MSKTKNGHTMPDKLYAKNGIRRNHSDGKVEYPLFTENYDKDHECIYTLSSFIKNGRKYTHFDDAIAKWLSAALEDEMICAEFKHDIRNWIGSFEDV